MESRLLICLVKLLSHMPFGLLYALSDCLYFPLYYLVRYRREIVRRNLTESFPEKSPKEIVQIEKRFYHFFIDMALETVKLLTISPEEMKRRMTFANTEEINAMGEAGKSVAVFLGHYGNWEWISSTRLWITEKATVAQIYHKLRDKEMDKLMLTLRERLGNKCVEMYSTARFATQAQKSGRPHFIGFIADQSPKHHESKHFLDFLNHRVPVLTGTERLAKHFGYEAMYISTKRVRRGYYECEFSLLHPDPQSLPDFELTALYFKRLEQEIKEHPEYYLWTHNRFKHATQA